MSDHVLVVDGVTLDPPWSLGPDEIEELGRFNADRSQGRSHDAETTAWMASLQLRFDWLGYVSEDGRHHGGRMTYPRPYVITGSPKRWWQR